MPEGAKFLYFLANKVLKNGRDGRSGRGDGARPLTSRFLTHTYLANFILLPTVHQRTRKPRADSTA